MDEKARWDARREALRREIEQGDNYRRLDRRADDWGSSARRSGLRGAYVSPLDMARLLGLDL